jgi:low temperature requirement protein LtrA
MLGRDPNQAHRAATPLELLFDLVFVVAFATAANELAYYIAYEKYVVAIFGFFFTMSGVCWAWTSATRFASAFDTDDWAYRLAILVQMLGVVVFALGIPAMFASIGSGGPVDNGVLVAGFIVMRVALVGLWLRAAWRQPSIRRTAVGTASVIALAQFLWVLTAILPLSPAVFASCAVAIFFVLEFAGPLVFQRRFGDIPWHAHHLGERYGLLTIIALGEGVIGTVTAVSVVTTEQGWSADAIVIVFAGIGLTFALWWVHFMNSPARILDRYRARQYVWSFLHIILWVCITAVGGALHTVAYVIEDKATISPAGAVTSVAISVACTAVMMMLIFVYIARTLDVFRLSLGLAGLVVVAVSIALAWSGVSIAVSLLVLTLAPAVVVVGFEVAGRGPRAVISEEVAAHPTV